MDTARLNPLTRLRSADGPLSARSSLVRVNRQMPRRGRAKAEKPIITVKNLTIGWGDTVLQQGLDFEVQRGEVFAILGGSGTGKSTLLRFLIGLEHPIAGEIDVAGRGLPDL